MGGDEIGEIGRVRSEGLMVGVFGFCSKFNRCQEEMFLCPLVSNVSHLWRLGRGRPIHFTH